MSKDYLELKCFDVYTDKMFVSIGDKICFECVEGNVRAAVTLTSSDLEKLIPFILKYYYNIDSNE
jgi:hypothetical protein